MARLNNWTTGFQPARVGDPREPKEPKPRCAVEGCERVVYKSVVCRKHWDAVPIELRMRRMADMMNGQQTAKAASDREILNLASEL